MSACLLPFARVLRGLAAQLAGLGDALAPVPEPVPTAKDLAHRDWLAAHGDQTLRLDYDLAPDAVVIDAGGFEGQWASDIFARNLCQVHVFEPVPGFAEQIRKRFVRNPSIHVHACALGGQDAQLSLSLEADASSAFAQGRDAGSVTAPVRQFSALCAELGIADIALIKINIEGGEYDLLDHIVASGLITRIGQLQIQFHDFVPDAAARMRAIQQALARTHEQTWGFPFIWENWRRKEA